MTTRQQSQQPLFDLPVNESSDDTQSKVKPDAYSLNQLEVYNWGPFSGLHRIHFDPRGCSLIGQTGSGKTTLVDAIMTLLCAQPRYNLASTGGHESDRDLISYIRGVTGIGGEDEAAHIARPAQTITGIRAEFSCAEKSVYLTALLWLDSTSSSQSDMKRLWIFDRDASSTSSLEKSQQLSDYLEQLKELGARGLKIQLKEIEGILVTENKKAYLAQCRRFFEVGENAFVLLNRAAGLKQLNNIDALFRELVLDDRAAFSRAAEVINEFDELQGIHAELQIAKRQQTSLLPIESNYKKHQKTKQKLEQLNQQYQLIPSWFAHHAVQLWSQQAEINQTEIQVCHTELTQAHEQLQQQQAQVDNAYQRYQQLGGASIEELKRQLNDKQLHIGHIKQKILDYESLCQNTDLNPTLSATQLIQNQHIAEQKLVELKTQEDELEQIQEQQTQQTLNKEEKKTELAEEISDVLAAPDSNIPGQFRRFQYELAQQLQIPVAEVPYIAQCIEVQDKPWQGAIERAIGSHRLRLVIAPEHIQNALNWVKQRDNKLHVRLLNSADYQQLLSPQKNGFCLKLSYKESIHQQTVKNFLASIDRRCINSSEELQLTAYAMTREGLMSGQQGLFEKQDQKPLTQGWMTGFDNQARLSELKEQYETINKQAQNLRKTLEQYKEQRQKLQNSQILLNQLKSLQFSDLDHSGAETILTQIQIRLDDLQNPESDTVKAEQLWQAAKQQEKRIQDIINQLTVRQELAQKELSRATQQTQQAKNRLPEPLTQAQLQRLSEDYSTPNESQLDNLPTFEREASQAIQQTISRVQNQLSKLQTDLGKQMVSAQKEDTGALAEVGTELEDVPKYLERLDLLSKEALPGKLDRFLNYLNQSSDQGVTQLLTRIENEVSIIEERIEELNDTMKEVDFQPGRYLQLVPQKVTHESLQSLQRSQRDLRSAALRDDQGESHYKALLSLIAKLNEAVERKRTRSALALLDPRYRLQFSVAIIDRKNDIVLETRTGSQGGSGGEKEIIASYILTASLSYALCPKDRNKPLFASVILDEAFSKSSQAVAARIIAALGQFGLHPLFVTPNKEMRLLRAHTASAVLVHRRGKQSQAVSLSWEEIDQHIQQHQALSHNEYEQAKTNADR